MAVHEIVHDPETPDAVIIDEAIEVAKKYGSEESGSFINGVLDDVRRRRDGGELQGPEDGPASV
jgi:N utilization substance protein B